MMIKNKKWLFLLIAVIGAVSFYIGGFVVIDEKFKPISGMCIGLGSALFCLGIGYFVIALTSSKTDNNSFLQRKNIEVADERNINALIAGSDAEVLIMPACIGFANAGLVRAQLGNQVVVVV